MIEQAMIFALGVCIAGLLALLCLPAITRRAMRIAQATVERQMPISVDEIVGQRDLLRAEFAADRRRVEQALERANEGRARAMADAGRRAAEIGRMSGELTEVAQALRAAGDAQEAAERGRRETEAENAALQKALFDIGGDAERWRERHVAAGAEIAGLEGKLAALTETVAALEAARESDLSARNALERDGLQTKLDLSIALTRAEGLAARIEFLEGAMGDASVPESDRRREVAGKEGRTGESEELALLRRAVVEIGQEVVRMAEDRQRTPLAVTDDARVAAQ